MKMLLKAEKAFEKKVFEKMNHEFKQFNFVWSLNLHLMHIFSLILQYFFFQKTVFLNFDFHCFC